MGMPLPSRQPEQQGQRPAEPATAPPPAAAAQDGWGAVAQWVDASGEVVQASAAACCASLLHLLASELPAACTVLACPAHLPPVTHLAPLQLRVVGLKSAQEARAAQDLLALWGWESSNKQRALAAAAAAAGDGAAEGAADAPKQPLPPLSFPFE